jgi:hypothetical protein
MEKMHKEGLRELYSPPSIIRVVEENEMGGACSTNGGEEERV